MPKVLLAEDDASMLYLLKTLLKMDGFEVAALELDGKDEQVLGRIAAEAPDVMLMDVHLAGRSGLDLLRKIRAYPATSRVAVIMSSGMNLEHECHDVGADAFLLKPYMPEELLRLLRSHLRPRVS